MHAGTPSEVRIARGSTPLHIAVIASCLCGYRGHKGVYYGHPGLVQKLMYYGAVRDVLDGEGMYPADYLEMCGDEEDLYAVRNSLGGSYDSLSLELSRAVRNAAASGDAPALAHLLKLDRSDRKNPESRLPDKYLWVIDAVDLSTTQHIMGCIDQLGRDRWWRDATPIGLACYYGHDACVSILLDCGASLVVGRLGLMTPIMCACLGALHTAQMQLSSLMLM